MNFLEAKDLGPFSSREVATLFWLMLMLGWALSRSEVRSSFQALLQAAFKWKIVVLCLLFWLWLSACTYFLASAGFWKLGVMKDTVLWGIFSGLAIVGRSVQLKDEGSLLRSFFHDSLAVSVVVEFMSNLYTFPLWIEVIVLPILTILMTFQYLAQRVPNGKTVERLFGCLAGFGGWLFLAYLCMAIYQHSQKLLAYDSLRQFSLPFILTAISVPAFYLIALYARYESLFVLQNIGDNQGAALKLYVRLKLIDLLRCSLTNIGVVHRRFSSEIRSLSSHDQTDAFCRRLRGFLKAREGGIAGMKSRSLERASARLKKLTLPMIPLFRRPWEASELVIELGLKDTVIGEPPWRSLEPGEWYSLADFRFEAGHLNWGNHVSCMHTSSDEAFIERCRWKIDVLNPDAGEEVISIAVGFLTKYLEHLGCEVPDDLFVFDGKAKEVQRETLEGWFVFKPLAFTSGFGWEFSITSKFADVNADVNAEQ